MPSRFLHEIEFFPDIVSEDIAIRHMKEITRHGLGQRPQGYGPPCDPYGGGVFLWGFALKGCKNTLVT
jgi:hypothetical protein